MKPFLHNYLLLVLVILVAFTSPSSAQQNQIEDKQISIQLFRDNSLAEGSTSSDGLIINFTHDGFNGLDWRDAPKINNQDENLARIIGQTLLAIENREFPIVNENLLLFINQFSTTVYQFRITVDEFDDVETVLFDNHLNLETPLEVGVNIYDFTINNSSPSSIANNRFAIKFKEKTFSVNEFSLNPIKVYPNPVKVGTKLKLEIPRLPSASSYTICLYSLTGQKIFTNKINSNTQSYIINTENLKKGIYILEVITDDLYSKFTKKIIVN